MWVTVVLFWMENYKLHPRVEKGDCSKNVDHQHFVVPISAFREKSMVNRLVKQFNVGISWNTTRM